MPETAECAASSLQSSRLVLFSGKGGTGKTTCAASLAMAFAAQGRRTLLVEIDSQQPSIEPVVGVRPVFDAQPAASNLWVSNVVWPESLVAYLRKSIPFKRLITMILENDVVQSFIDFMPGAREVATLVCLADEVERYDHVVVDLPASGHAFALLDITRTANRMFRTGPVADQLARIDALLKAPTTQLVLVAIPEQMVVNETLETADRIRSARMLSTSPAVWLNRVRRAPLTPELRDELTALLQDEPPWAEDARWALECDAAARVATDRLAAVGGASVVLPLCTQETTMKGIVEAIASRLLAPGGMPT
ncbi:MAG: ArsA family ATPase [Myxococcota bacterium]